MPSFASLAPPERARPFGWRLFLTATLIWSIAVGWPAALHADEDAVVIGDDCIPAHGCYLGDRAGWEAAVSIGSVWELTTNAAGIRAADEVTSPAGVDEQLCGEIPVSPGCRLTFRSHNSGLPVGFTFRPREGVGLTFRDAEPPPSIEPGFNNAISVGDIGDSTDDDFFVEILEGPRVWGFGFDLCDSNGEPREELVVRTIRADSREQEKYYDLSSADSTGKCIFVGIATDRHIRGIEYREDAGSDDIAVRDFVFATPADIETSLKILPSDIEKHGHFGGGGLALDDSTLVVVATSEETVLWVFEREGGPGGGSRWLESAKLTPPDADNTDSFAYFKGAVALSGDTLAVGCLSCAESGLDAGAVYLFRRSDGVWAWDRKLLGPSPGDEFGTAVALAGDRLLVGAPGSGESGTAYLHARNEGGPDSWGRIASIKPRDHPTKYSQFGYFVALEDGVAVVSAPYHPGHFYGQPGQPERLEGAAYVYEQNLGGKDAWGQAARLKPGILENHDWYGHTLALERDTLVVATWESPGVFVYQRKEGGGWALRKRITDAFADDINFSRDLALSGDRLFVAAPYAGSGLPYTGRVQLYERNAGGTGAWGQVGTLEAHDPVERNTFGRTIVADRGSAAIVATDWDGSDMPGSVHLFVRMIFADGFESGDLSAWSTP